MNDCCLAEWSEYKGQYKEEISGAIEGCNCCNCRQLRAKYLNPIPPIIVENKPINTEQDPRLKIIKLKKS